MKTTEFRDAATRVTRTLLEQIRDQHTVQDQQVYTVALLAAAELTETSLAEQNNHYVFKSAARELIRYSDNPTDTD